MGGKQSSRRGGSSMDKKFTDEVVKAHNDYRKRHQAPPLSHSKELSAQAQKWADHLAATNSFQHSQVTLHGEKLGENIAMKWSSAPDAYTGQEVTDQWYSEVKMYVFGAEPRDLNAGHFTQVVWRGSKEVGVGKASARDGKVIVVANYRPAGNRIGSFAENVQPPKDGKIILPPEPASRPTPTRTTTTTSQFSQRGGGQGGPEGLFSQRFGGVTSTSSKSESRSVRTYTVTEGVGASKVTKTVTEETIIKANGEKIVNKKETITSGGSAPSAQSSHLAADFGRMALKDQSSETKSKKKSKPFWKSKRSGSSSSSSSDSSPERGSASKGKKSVEKSASKPQKMADFHKDCLKAHNAKRALHKAQPLSLASDLSEHAQKWAEHLASKDMTGHSRCMVNGERVGENIAYKWSSDGADYTGAEAVAKWYSEIKQHDFKTDGAMASGHFTQVVWRGSKELGVGKAKTGSGKCIVVCNYRPAGNMIGSYRDNVFPPK